MHRLGTDLGFAARSLARRPGFLALTVATLALGIGANTAIFSIVDRVLLAPLPFPDADRLAVVYNAPRGSGGFAAASEVVYSVFARSPEPFEAIAAIAPTQVNVGGDRDPERITAAAVTASFFEVASIAPVLGRGFDALEDRPGAEGVAVLGHGLWQRRFGASEKALGQNVVVDGAAHRIVGVMPPGFELLWPRVEMWLPLAVDEAGFDATTVRNNNRVLIARTGTDLESANAAMPALVESLRNAFPNAVGDDQAFRLLSLREHISGELRPTLLLLLGAVALVLLIACANVANLILVRCADRSRELRLRAALGAGLPRLTRLLIVESLLLAAAGALAGGLIAWGALQAIRPLAPADVPIPTIAELDLRILGFTLLITATTVLVCGTAPALIAARRALRRSSAERSPSSRVSASGRGSLVVVEVALAVVLLVGSCLLIRSLLEVSRVEPGFELDGRIVADLSLSAASSDAELGTTLRTLVEESRALPGVEAAGAAQWMPLRGNVNWGFEVEGRTDEDVRFVDYNLVSPGTFEALGIPVREGRDFEWSDLEDSRPRIVVSSSIADRLWPGESAIGKRLNFDLGERVWREVVGVVGEIRNRSLATPPRGLVYFPPVTLPFADPASMSLVAATGEREPEALAAPLRDLVRAVDPSAPVGAVASLRDIARDSLREQRFLMLLLSLFASSAILLAGIGLYGVLATTLAQRHREIGVRLALGARAVDVLRWVAWRAAALVGSGLAIGLGGALLLTRLLESSLYGVGPRDAPAFAAAAVLLVLVAVLAALRPARRAACVDPVVTLRDE